MSPVLAQRPRQRAESGRNRGRGVSDPGRLRYVPEQSGMEKTSHHTATITNERRTASAGPASPNVPGESVIATLRANSKPPPM